MRSSILCAWIVLAVCSPARAEVIVVDPGGGPGGAALLQAAISAAQPGDILLLRPGDYSSLPGLHPLVDKPLSLVVDGPPGSVVLSGLQIDNTPFPDALIVLRGLHVAPAPLTSQDSAAVEVRSSGLHWCEGCVFTGSSNPAGAATAGLAAFTGSTGFEALALERCTLTGGDGRDEVPATLPALPGAPALFLTVFTGGALHETVFQGGRGGDGDPFVGGGTSTANGGAGVADQAGIGWLLGSTLIGGDEGSSNPAATQPGPGLQIGLGGHIFRRDSEIHAGAVNGAGTPVADIVSFGTVMNFPAATRSLSLPSPMREGEGGFVHVEGEVGDGVWIFVGLSAQFFMAVFPAQGLFLVGSLLPQAVFLGTITDPSGVLEVPFHCPQLPDGTDGAVLFLQCAMLPAAGGKVLGSGTALVVVDSSI